MPITYDASTATRWKKVQSQFHTTSVQIGRPIAIEPASDGNGAYHMLLISLPAFQWTQRTLSHTVVRGGAAASGCIGGGCYTDTGH